MRSKLGIFIILNILFFSSCSKSILEQAEKLYQNKDYINAVKYYEKYYKLNKKDSDYAAYMAGMIYSSYLGNCNQGIRAFEFLVKNYPESKYYQESYFRSFVCPNYIYPKYNTLVYGDSSSYGKNAREIINIKSKNFKRIDFISKIYAGKKLISTQKKYCIIKDNEVLDDKNRLIIKYPLSNSWEYKLNSQKYFVKIENAGKIKVKAGEFENCIMIIEKGDSTVTENINYYAPEVGRILTTTRYNKKETRIMELISYE